MKPTNITLLDPKSIKPGIYKPITTADAFEGMTNNLNDEGLYSTEIFGKVGSKERDETEAYIDTKLFIFNPVFFEALTSLKSLYLGIIKGTEYAIWSEAEKDFIKSNMMDGQTGFSFFVKHFRKIKFSDSPSYQRRQKIRLVKEFADRALTDKVLVLPAGLREIQFNPNGSVTEQEINEYYRKLFIRTQVVTARTEADKENNLFDSVRWGMQNSFNELDQYIFGLSEGKRGLFQNKINTRGVVHGTRNVITARKVSRESLGEDTGIDPNTVDIGLLQALLAYQYTCTAAILNSFIDRVFTTGSLNAKLVKPKTLEFDYIKVSPETVEKWTTATGINKLFNGFSNVQLRHRPIIINDHYLALVYDDGKEVNIIQDINEVPSDRNRKYVTPITYSQFFYLVCYRAVVDNMGQITRYPIAGVGSILPVNINLLTTTMAKPRDVLDETWSKVDRVKYYPHNEKNPQFFDAMSVDASRYSGLTADNDGDQLNLNAVVGEDSKAEARALMGKREYYISGAGNMLYDPVNEPMQFMLKTATSGLNK